MDGLVSQRIALLQDEIRYSRLIVDQDPDPEVRTLATKLIETLTNRIQQLKRLL